MCTLRTKMVYVIGVKPKGRVNLICQVWFRSGDVRHLFQWETKAEVRVPDIQTNWSKHIV